MKQSENPSSDFLVSSLPENDLVYRKLVRTFVAKIPGYVAQMREFVDQSDWKNTRARAHQLKGTGGSYGFPLLSAIAAELEILADGDCVDPQKVRLALDRLDDVGQRATEGLKHWQ